MRELILDKDEEITALKETIKSLKEKLNEVVKSTSKEEWKNETSQRDANLIELLKSLNNAERLIWHYKDVFQDLQASYPLPEEIIKEFELDAKSILEKSFTKDYANYGEGDDMDTNPNNILETSYDEPLPVQHLYLETSQIKHKSKIPVLDLSKVPIETSSEEEEEEDEQEQAYHQAVSVSSNDDPDAILKMIDTDSDNPEYRVWTDELRQLDRDSD